MSLQPTTLPSEAANRTEPAVLPVSSAQRALATKRRTLKLTVRSSKEVRQRERLIFALLQQPSLEKAAESIGISRSTAWRIRRTPEFQQEYLQARREALSESWSRLMQASSAAVTTLVTMMNDPNAPASSRIRAADSILKHAAEAAMSEDVEMRLQRIERLTFQDKKKESVRSVGTLATP